MLLTGICWDLDTSPAAKVIMCFEQECLLKFLEQFV